MRIYNIVNLDFGKDRLKEFCINNFNSLSASIKSIIAQVRVNVKNIKANNEGLNELASSAVLQDENGNIAYGGATIPSDVDPDFLHIFYSSNVVKIIDATNYIIYDSINAYLSGGLWYRISSGQAHLTRTSANPSSVIQTLYTGSSGAGTQISWDDKFIIDGNGNVNIKTGSTYTATL